jgi:A/G-specific adenine glycosylase
VTGKNISQDYSAFRKRLLSWWKSNKINYPWRFFNDPFSILVGEILLRKTNAEKVQKLILLTLNELNSFEKILEMKSNFLKSLLKPYGLQKNKAQELKALSNYLINKHGGHIPDKYSEMIQLPGVGPYIANAVLGIGFGQRRPIIDTNVIRIYERYFRFISKKKRPRDDKNIWKFAEEILPKKRFKEFNYALLDFGKKVCKANKPLCSTCPLKTRCKYNFAHLQCILP